MEAAIQKRTIRLFPKQIQARRYLLDDETEELIYGGAAGGGKSRLGCSWLIEMCGRYPGTRWFMGRAVLKELKRTTLKTFFEVAGELGMRAGYDYIYRQDEGITFVKGGSEIVLLELAYLPSDPSFDRFGSFEFTGGFVDECQQIVYKAWETLKTRCRYMLDKYGLIPKMLGTLNPTKGWPYGEFYLPWKKGLLKAYRKFLQSLPTDNPFLPASYIKALRRLKDKAQKQRLYYGNWEYDDDPAALFSIDTISDLFTNRAAGGERYISGDVSRKGRDRMVLGYWDGFQCREIAEIPPAIKQDSELAGKFILAFAERHGVRRSRIILDDDGVGGPIVDHLKCKGFVNGSSPIITKAQKELAERTGRIVNYANLKSQCYHLLADAAEAGRIGITCDDPDTRDLITEELEQIKRANVDKDGKVAVVGKDAIKENIGRSPDFADMLMMRMRFELPFEQQESRSAALPFIAGVASAWRP